MIKSPAKIFPCDCEGEGVIVGVEEDKVFFDCPGAPFISLAFWEFGSKYDSRVGLSRWQKIKYAWRILRGKSPWVDMVWMRAEIARNLANHILYIISKSKKKTTVDESLMLVKSEDISAELPTAEEMNITIDRFGLDLIQGDGKDD